jgi:hypothetical protein
MVAACAETAAAGVFVVVTVGATAGWLLQLQTLRGINLITTHAILFPPSAV